MTDKDDKKKGALKMTPPGNPAAAEKGHGKTAGGPANRDRFIDEARWSRRKNPVEPVEANRPAPSPPPTNPFSLAELPGPWGDFWKAAMDFQMGLLRNATRFSPMGLALDVRLWSGALDEMVHQMAAEDPERETKVVSEAASYGTQLTAIMDVLDGLIDRLEPENAGAEDAEELRRAIERFRELKERITSV